MYELELLGNYIWNVNYLKFHIKINSDKRNFTLIFNIGNAFWDQNFFIDALHFLVQNKMANIYFGFYYKYFKNGLMTSCNLNK